MKHGINRLVTELTQLGHQVEAVSAGGADFAVMRGFEIGCGRFAGRVIDLALQATADFPNTVASAIHVRGDPPPLDYADTKRGVRNIIKSALGPEWRYWSHNFGWSGPSSARRLMSQVNGIFENA